MNKSPRYRDKRLREFAAGDRVKDFHSFEKQLDKRLKILEGAVRREDLKLLPSNHFESLASDRKGQYSIRINKQWRLCFEWPNEASEPFNIEVVDYH